MLTKSQLKILLLSDYDDMNTVDLMQTLMNLYGSPATTAKAMWLTVDKWFVVVWPDDNITEERIKEVSEKYDGPDPVEIIGYKQMAFVKPDLNSLLVIDDIMSELCRTS